MLCQLSYTHHSRTIQFTGNEPVFNTVARQKGLEPLTHGLEGRCSVHLSYWRDRGEPI
jgi:hypothetical protein